MAGAKSIEALSVSFTAGVFAGTIFPAAGSRLLPTLLMALSGLPFLLQKKICRLPEKEAVGLLLGTFLLSGIFCAWTAAIPTPDLSGPIGSFAADCAQNLCRHIASIPFRDDATTPLLQALLTGNRSGLSPQVSALFRQSGASHLLALSGLHMGILYLLLDYPLRLLGKSAPAKIIRFCLVVPCAGFFTLMTGASPSLVRAFLFILIGETLRLSGRPRHPSRILCLALLLQLAINPAAAGSTGFQLSYLAMAGILLLYPVLEKWYPDDGRWNPFRRIWKAAALCISCQVFTAPLVWIRFHSFPRYFLLTNLLAVPLTTVLMGTAVTTLLLQALNCCPACLITVTDGLSRLLLQILEVISSM